MLKVKHRSGSLEWRYIPVDWYVIGHPRYIPISIVSTTAHASAKLATTEANRLAISTDGLNFTALGADVTTGYDLGAFTPGQRKDYTLRVLVPGGTNIRVGHWALEIGEGT